MIGSYDCRQRRRAYRLGQGLALAVLYVVFVVTSPLLGLWLVWQSWLEKNPKNVIFAHFGRR